MPKDQTSLTDNRLLTRNVFWNLLGMGIPLLVALYAIPLLIDGLGISRFGILTIVWMVIGYFNLFDLGVGRALTLLVAEKLSNGEENDIPKLVWTALFLISALGLVGGICLATIAPWLTYTRLHIPPDIQGETLTTIYILAASVPLILIIICLRGFLEANQRFALITIIRIPVGILTFIGPLCVLPFSNSLVPVVITLVFIKLISCFAYIVSCLKVYPPLIRIRAIQKTAVVQLIKLGGWMTVTNIVGPLMTYLDRILIASMLSITLVAYYTTPYDIIIMLWIIPIALMGVMFPAFASSFMQNKLQAAQIFSKTVNCIFIILFPIVLVVVTFADKGLAVWLGSEFALKSSFILQLLAIGVFINCMAAVPFGLVQSAGRPDLTAKLHLVELPIYLFVLWFLVSEYGLIGAAIAWIIRALIDTSILYIMAQRLLPTISIYKPTAFFFIFGSLSVLFLNVFIHSEITKTIFAGVILVSFIPTVWFIVLGPTEKKIIFRGLNTILIFCKISH